MHPAACRLSGRYKESEIQPQPMGSLYWFPFEARYTCASTCIPCLKRKPVQASHGLRLYLTFFVSPTESACCWVHGELYTYFLID